MVLKVRAVGNSLGVLLPAEVTQKLRVGLGDARSTDRGAARVARRAARARRARRARRRFELPVALGPLMDRADRRRACGWDDGR